MTSQNSSRKLPATLLAALLLKLEEGGGGERLTSELQQNVHHSPTNL